MVLVRRWIAILIGLFMPLVVWANPVMVDPSSLLAFTVVAFWALLVEAGVVALLLTWQGLNPLRIFLAYAVTNALIFLMVFEPLLSSDKAPVPVLEALVVLLDALAIKLLAQVNGLQGDDFKSVSWLRAFGVSSFGNLVSFFIGIIASRKPWEH